MSKLQTVHGRIVELRRHVNVHFSHRRPFASSERYELWIRRKDGSECKFTLNTRTMPARRGHEVCLIVMGSETPEVLGLVNVSAPCEANYIRTDLPFLLRGRDALVVLTLTVALLVKWGRNRHGIVRSGRDRLSY